MIKFKKDMSFETREGMRGGPGSVKLLSALPAEAMPPHCRLLAPMVLEKGCGIGAHVHEEETEVYCCVAGEGIYNDNGTEHVIKPGDITSTGNGENHSIRNEKDEPLVILAFINTVK